MKTSKGFTLIELLAVIVILAIIALIATPLVMGVINDAKKGAAKDSMYAYVKSLELASTRTLTPDSELPSGIYQTKNGHLMNGSNKLFDIDLKGVKPSDGVGKIIIEDGILNYAMLKFDNYCIRYDGQRATNVDDCSLEESVYDIGTEVYYNPETNKKCSIGEVNPSLTAKTGCLKWYTTTLNDDKNKVALEIIPNHNTTRGVSWNDSGSNVGGMKEVADALQIDVATWDYRVKDTARLITGQEVADINNIKRWKANENSVNTVYKDFLFENCGSGASGGSAHGYWTSTANPSDTALAWRVGCCVGSMSTHDVKLSRGSYYGVRPIITILKDVIK